MSVSPTILRDSTHNYILPTTNTSTNDELISTSSTQTLVNKTLTDPTIWLNGDDIQSILNNKVSLADLNTLKIEIFKMIYPIGSIYQSFEPVNNHSTIYTDEHQHVQVSWNDCVWQLIDSDTFLRNVNHTYTQDGTRTPITDRFLYCSNTSGTIGGEPEHTLTIDEMPSHSHVYRMFHENMGALGLGNPSIRIETDNNNLTATAGGNLPHNNLPPYIIVYMYQRIQ